MKSGLEDRNNETEDDGQSGETGVSMKSGLEDRNNLRHERHIHRDIRVSMKSGLEDRNNPQSSCATTTRVVRSQ